LALPLPPPLPLPPLLPLPPPLPALELVLELELEVELELEPELEPPLPFWPVSKSPEEPLGPAGNADPASIGTLTEAEGTEANPAEPSLSLDVPDPLEDSVPVDVLPGVAVVVEPDPAVLATSVATFTPAAEHLAAKASRAFDAWLPQALAMDVCTWAALSEQIPFTSDWFGWELSALRRHAGGLPAKALTEPAARMIEMKTALVCILDKN